MKKVLAIVLAAVMILSCSMTAFAEVCIDGEKMSEEHKTTTTNVTVSWRLTDGGKGVDVTVQEGSLDPKYVSVSAAGEKLYIDNNNVEGDSTGSKPTIQSTTDNYGTDDGNPTSVVSVGGDVNESHDNAAVVADEHGVVSIEGNVTESGGGNAVESKNGSAVRIKGNLKESGAGDAIYATNMKTGSQDVGDGAKVTVEGNVVEEDAGRAIYAEGQGTTVTIYGDVTESGAGDAISAKNNAKVAVGGDVESDDVAIVAGESGRVIVEGIVTGNVSADSTTEVLIGTLNGDIKSEASKGNIHYLIGLADGSKINESLIVTEDTGNIIAQYARYSADNKKAYRYTTTADSATLNGKSFTIASVDSKKKIKINGSYPGVTIANNPDGTVTFTIGENFRGGLQGLDVIFEDIARKISGGSTRTINTGSAANPVTNGKWTQNADGTWSYATAYKFTDTWGCIANPNDANSVGWYYFDRNGNMLTGWQLLTWNGVKKWYYFSQTKDANEGKCLINGITPDGYRVGPDGAWIEG